jgi:CheY-like chemotaxis protein
MHSIILRRILYFLMGKGWASIMSSKCRIVIAEDHTILREGLRALLSSSPDFDSVGEAEDGREAIRCVEKLKPNLILTDLFMPMMNTGTKKIVPFF